MSRLPLEVLEMEVTSDSSINACIAEVLSRCAGIDVVINNAHSVPRVSTKPLLQMNFVQFSKRTSSEPCV